MIILDTNVLSALMRAKPDPLVIKWLDQQPRQSLWTTSITILEIRFGIALLPAGRRPAILSAAFDRALAEVVEHRIAVLDADAAREASIVMAMSHRKGRSIDLRDAMIAGVALANRATLATGNVRHFDGLSVPRVSPGQ
jgi:toxin FitB